MMLSQRFPTYFDGILAGSATYRLSRTYVDSPWGIQQVNNIAPADTKRRRGQFQLHGLAPSALLKRT